MAMPYGPRWRATPSTRFAVFAVPALVAIAGCSQPLLVVEDEGNGEPQIDQPATITGEGYTATLGSASYDRRYVEVEVFTEGPSGYAELHCAAFAADGRPLGAGWDNWSVTPAYDTMMWKTSERPARLKCWIEP